LLDTAADLIDYGRAELDDMERVQDRDRVRELVADGVGVAAERVQCGMLDGGGEPFRLSLEPGGVGRARATWDDVEQARAYTSGLVTGQVDHRGHRPVSAVMTRLPDVFVDPQSDHPDHPRRVREPPDRLSF